MASKYLIYKNRKNEFKKLLDRAVKLDIVSAQPLSQETISSMTPLRELKMEN